MINSNTTFSFVSCPLARYVAIADVKAEMDACAAVRNPEHGRHFVDAELTPLLGASRWRANCFFHSPFDLVARFADCTVLLLAKAVDRSAIG